MLTKVWEFRYRPDGNKQLEIRISWYVAYARPMTIPANVPHVDDGFWDLFEKHGPTFNMHVFWENILITTDPESIKVSVRY